MLKEAGTWKGLRSLAVSSGRPEGVGHGSSQLYLVIEGIIVVVRSNGHYTAGTALSRRGTPLKPSRSGSPVPTFSFDDA